MTLPNPCSAECVLRGIDQGETLPLTISAREEYCIVIDNRVLKLIPARSHTARHPLYLESDRLDCAGRRDLLRELAGRSFRHVVPICRVCHCSFESRLLPGVPLRDFGGGPDGDALAPPALRKPRWPPQHFQRFLGELAQGLLELHEAGAAHGDPVLLNAFVRSDAAGERAACVDISSVRNGTDEARAVDTAAFLELCVWPAMLDFEFSSDSLMRDILSLNKNAVDVLSALHDALPAPRTDYERRSAKESRLRLLRGCDPLTRTDELGQIQRRLCAALGASYFLDYTVSDATARFFRSLLEAERTRNAIFEEDRSRLLYLRFENQNDELRDWSSQLQGAVDCHNNRAERVEDGLRKTAKLLEQSQTWARELQTAVEHHTKNANMTRRIDPEQSGSGE